ncbi:unnamed protein product [Phaedon cochleariae]|uniref:DUF229 domain containing protein n=1 Tax=Phaedon cochleariae TaxID=80249 RepID=A0A9P0DM97_PHACE|nr:unnamed protein product [Phaedon cochleariae]
MRRILGNAVKLFLFFWTCKVIYRMYHQNIFMAESLDTGDTLELFEAGSENENYEKFLIDTPGCTIPNLDAFSPEIAPFVYKMKKLVCTDKPLLTYIQRSSIGSILHVNKSSSDYSYLQVKCCYREVTRGRAGQNIDNDISFSECHPFKKAVLIQSELIKVECSTVFGLVYENIHFIMKPPEKPVSNAADPNVILIGIDGVSRSNLMRTMPKTQQFCEKNNWVNLKGYNKVEDNTYPNFIAVLAGVKFDDRVSTVCDPYHKDSFESCNFIWNQYKDQNYSTAYAEDAPTISTFNLKKVGFTSPPTDYYFRPYFLAADQLPPKYLCLKAHCTGPEKTGIRMQNLITDFLSTNNDSAPSFGLFWMNSFSHEGLNCPTSMDDDFAAFFERMQADGYLDNTIVVFFSDHGFRFGKIRLTHVGWLEERLPFIYIHIPERFRKVHEEEYKNLLDNSEKLTTPYDLHMTLQHILSLSDPKYTEIQAEGCPLCKSLFKKISPDRSCDQAGVPQHYCTCSLYVKIDKNLPLVREVAQFFVGSLNEKVGSYGAEASECREYSLQDITHAQLLVIEEGKEENILISVVTNPEANFEGTVKVLYDTDGSFQLSVSNINRLDRYAPKTYCVRNSPVQIYCYCKSTFDSLINVFCNNKFCFLYLLVLYYPIQNEYCHFSFYIFQV